MTWPDALRDRAKAKASKTWQRIKDAMSLVPDAPPEAVDEIATAIIAQAYSEWLADKELHQ